MPSPSLSLLRLSTTLTTSALWLAEATLFAFQTNYNRLWLQDDINRQNAAFCCGLLVEANPEQAAPFLHQLLTALHNMFRPDEAAGARDNAVGAVGRILCALPYGALPLQQVLPVLLGALPLQVGRGA